MSTRGERLKQALARRGVAKHLALAHELGVHQSAITRWKDDGAMSLAKAVELCVLLDLSLDWFLLGRGSMDQHLVVRAAGEGAPADPMLLRWTRAQSALPAAVLARILDLTDTLIENNARANLL